MYKKHHISDQLVHWLVLLKERRIQVMGLALESIFGGHIREEKTRERIRLSFVWPKMRRDFVKLCKLC